MADNEHALMQALKSTAKDPAANAWLAYAQLCELMQRNHPVLPVCKRNDPSPAPSGRFRFISDRFLPLGGHRGSVAAGPVPIQTLM
jgi:hypothetical protein